MTENENPEPTDDDLAALPAERLAELLRDKRKSEASYRTRLREAEQERDGLRGTVNGFQQGALRDAASKAGIAKTALADLESHVPLANVLGDDGTLDPKKADAALRGLRTERPHLFRQGSPSSGAEMYDGAGNAPQVTDWADVLRS